MPFLDDVLLEIFSREDADPDYSYFDHALRFYAMQRLKQQQRLFVKTDSWHIFFYRRLRELYPSVPFILLYRHPAEVIRSQQQRRGRHAVQGVIDPRLFGFESDVINLLTLDQYMARVLERYFEEFLAAAKQDPLSVLINYNEGAVGMMERIAEAAQLPLSGEYRAQIAERAGRPSVPLVPEDDRGDARELRVLGQRLADGFTAGACHVQVDAQKLRPQLLDGDQRVVAPRSRLDGQPH